MSRHTPGPWGRIIADGYTVRHPQIYSDKGPVANATWLGDGRLDELNANARLISAAPDLLAALQEVIAAADGKGWEQLSPSLKNQRMAVAKAGGES